MRVPFVVYAGFECFTEKLDTTQPTLKKATLSCKTFAQWQTTTEAAEVVQREERLDDRAMVFSHVFRPVQVCYFFWKERSQSVEEKG